MRLFPFAASRARLFCFALLLSLSACGDADPGRDAKAATPVVTEEAARAPTASTVATPASGRPDDCSVAYWGDSISALTGPRIDRRLDVTLHAVVGGTALAAMPEFMQDDMDERFIVIQYGTNDANGGSDLVAPLRAMLAKVKAMNRTPVLTGLSNATVGNLAVHANYDLLMMSFAREYGAIFVDWPGVPYAGAADLMPDGVHPNDGYQQRLADRLSRRLLAAAPECLDDL